MISSFEEAEKFVQTVIDDTRNSRIKWEENKSGGFIQSGHGNMPSYYMFVETPHPTVLLRGNGEAFDLAVSPLDNTQHEASLERLSKAVTKQLGLLF